MTTMKISAIRTDFFVRKALNEEYVITLALLIESGKVLPPVDVTTDGVLIDGRHRLSAMQMLGIAECRVRVVNCGGTMAGMLAAAVKANFGGSMPPTKADLVMVMGKFAEYGVTFVKVCELVPFIPKSMVRRLFDDAQSMVAKRKINQAIALIGTGNLTIAKAAAKADVDVEAVRAALGQKKKKVKAASNVKGKITSRFRSIGRKNAADFQRLIDEYDDYGGKRLWRSWNTRRERLFGHRKA